MVRWLTNDKLEGIWKEAVVNWLKYYPGMIVENNETCQEGGVSHEIRTEYLQSVAAT
jgi:hypothetical protein